MELLIVVLALVTVSALGLRYGADSRCSREWAREETGPPAFPPQHPLRYVGRAIRRTKDAGTGARIAPQQEEGH